MVSDLLALQVRDFSWGLCPTQAVAFQHRGVTQSLGSASPWTPRGHRMDQGLSKQSSSNIAPLPQFLPHAYSKRDEAVCIMHYPLQLHYTIYAITSVAV